MKQAKDKTAGGEGNADS